jgi:hypothetical protein
MSKRTLMIGSITAKDRIAYKELGKHGKRGLEVWKWPLDKIAVKDGFNYRLDMGDIDILAEGILESKGTDPINVDILEDGIAVITTGERRYSAYMYLTEKGHTDEWLKTMNVIINNQQMSDADRKMKNLVSNNLKKADPFEEAAQFLDLIENEGLKAADIAKRLGTNRMHVSNRLVLAKISAIEKEFITDKLISTTEWVKLYKAMPDIVQRVNALIDATKDGVVVNDIDADILASYVIKNDIDADILASYVIKKDFAAEHDKENTGDPESTENLKAVIDDIDEHMANPKIYNDQGQPVNFGEEGNPAGLDKKTADPFVQSGNGLSELLDKPKTGLSALLAQSNVAPSEEPDPVYKKKPLTAKDIVGDDVGSTLGDQDPETGTVTDTLKEVVVLLRSLERHFKGDSKMSDITFKIDKKVRYLQVIAKTTMMGNLTGVVPEPAF